MSKQKLDIKQLPVKAVAYGRKLGPYSFLIFLVFVAGLYSFVIFRVNTLSNTEPSEAAVSSQAKTAQNLHIDTAVVKQLKSLQDNSVSVQALFDQARSNPFQ